MSLLSAILSSLLVATSAFALLPDHLRAPTPQERQVERLLDRREVRLRARQGALEDRGGMPRTSIATQRFRAFFRSGTFPASRRTDAPLPAPAAPSRPASRSSSSAAPAPAPAPAAAPGVSRTVERIREEVLRLVNDERARTGLGPLTAHPLLSASAQAYARWMADETFFSHTDPEGRSSLDRIRDTGYLSPPCDCEWQYAVGENLARHQKTPAEVVRAWMDSPDHRANILHPLFAELGVGFADGYWVQHFGGVRAR